MLNEKSITLSKYRLEQAKEFLESAIKNLEMNEYKTANNRAYYSVFHSMRAVVRILSAAQVLFVIKAIMTIFILLKKMKPLNRLKMLKYCMKLLKNT